MPTLSRLDRAGLALFALLAVVPVLASLAYALLYGLGAVGLLSAGATLAHVRAVARNPDVWASFALSLGVAAAVTLLTAALALPLALRLRRRVESGALATVLSLPLALPGTVAGLLAFQLLAASGLVSRLALRLGLSSGMAAFPEVVNDRWGVGIVATHTALAVPFFVLLLVELFASERVERLLDLARSLGATPAQALVRVTLPVLLRRAAPSLTLLFVFVLGSYEIPLLLGRQSPQMVSVLVMRKYALFDITRKPEAFLVALAYTLLVASLVGLASRQAARQHAG